MRVLHFTKGAQTRCLDPESKTCVFLFRGEQRVTRLGCATTYAVRLIDAGWILSRIDDDA